MTWRTRFLLAAMVAFLPAVLSRGALPVTERADLVRAERELRKLEADNAALARKVAAVEAEVRALQRGDGEIERIARQELHLVRPDEVVYRLVWARPNEEANP
ncbi:MAG: septum formation initiator family protein [Deltaproteobacteria bacterium]|nr:MAG: septum formation initiator family protein [Deltaproteobacteria bacterium]